MNADSESDEDFEESPPKHRKPSPLKTTEKPRAKEKATSKTGPMTVLTCSSLNDGDAVFYDDPHVPVLICNYSVLGSN